MVNLSFILLRNKMPLHLEARLDSHLLGVGKVGPCLIIWQTITFNVGVNSPELMLKSVGSRTNF